MYFCENKSPRTFSENVYEYLKEYGIASQIFKGARRPFDHYRPTESAWYIVPSSELPFFKFGKFYFEWNSTSSINCGVICTKGLAKELSIVYPSKKGRRLIMEDDSWAFQSWVSCCENMKLLPVLSEIQHNLPGIELKIRLKGSYVDDPGLFDPYTEEKKAFDQYELGIDTAADKINVIRAVRQAMNLKILNQVYNSASFGRAMAQIAADNFLWCDFFIGTTFQIADESSSVLQIEDIVRNFLTPLSVFVTDTGAL